MTHRFYPRGDFLKVEKASLTPRARNFNIENPSPRPRTKILNVVTLDWDDKYRESHTFHAFTHKMSAITDTIHAMTHEKYAIFHEKHT